MGRRRDEEVLSAGRVIAGLETLRARARAEAEATQASLDNLTHEVLVICRDDFSGTNYNESPARTLRRGIADLQAERDARFVQCSRCGEFVHELQEHRCPDEEASP